MNINKEYRGTLDWNVAGLFAYDDFWIPFLTSLKENDIDIPFQYIYGTPNNVKIGGGRNINGKDNFSGMSDRQIFDTYMGLGVGCRLALSNHLIEPDYYKSNENLNNILNYLNMFPGNGIIVSDDDFNEYIRSKYPNLQRICSVIRTALDCGWGNETPEYYDSLCEKYDIVVVNCGFAKILKNIDELKYKDKIEVIANTRCSLNCKLAKMHYDIIAETYLKDPYDVEKDLELQTREQLLLQKCGEVKTDNILEGANFSTSEIQQLVDKGIHHFKLEGRDWPVEIMANDLKHYVCDEVLLTRLYKNITNLSI